jgi:hypothetical protein
LGFGSYLIENCLSDATVRRDFAPTGLVCTIDVALAGTQRRFERWRRRETRLLDGQLYGVRNLIVGDEAIIALDL